MAELPRKRIGELTPFTSTEIDGFINDDAAARQWKAALDYKAGDGESEDFGTKQITLDRIVLLTENRQVPAKFLPSSISETIEGNMVLESGEWKFTATDTGTVYQCPHQEEGVTEEPTIDVIYLDNTPSDEYCQYRYVKYPAGDSRGTGTFVPIPNDLKMVDGEGTVIKDDLSAYSRQVDLNIGTPQPKTTGVTTVLEVQTISNERKLVHTKSGIAAGTYPANLYPSGESASTFDFGKAFNVAAVTVDETGHVTGTTAGTITIPDTAASTADKGLVKVGTDANIQQIGSANSVGSAASQGYLLVAAADHVHEASTLQFLNANAAFSYNGSTNATYDFTNVLKTGLPTVAPSGANKILRYNSTALKAEWATLDDVLVPEFIEVSATDVNATSSYSTVGTPMGSLARSGGRITGLKANKLYLITYELTCTVTTANAFITSAVLSATKASSGEYGQANLLVNGSITIPQYVSGSIMFSTDNTANQTVGFSVGPGQIGWGTVAGRFQIAEIK